MVVLNAHMDTAVDVLVGATVIAEDLEFGETTDPIPVDTNAASITFLAAGTNRVVATQAVKPSAGQTWLVGAAQGSKDCGKSCLPAQLGFAKASTSAPSGTTTTLSVPFQVFPKSTAETRAAVASLPTTAGQTTLDLPLQNAGARNQPTSINGAQTPLTGAFELTATSGQLTGVGAGSQADIQYIGVTNSYPVTGAASTALLFFGTTVFDAWSTPNEIQVRIYIDSIGPAGAGSPPDGIDDYVLLNTSYASVTNQQQNDVFVSLLYRINPDGSLTWTGVPPFRFNSLPSPTVSPFVDIAPYNSRVMFQYLTSTFIGLTNTQANFNYHVETRARDIGNFGQVVDRVPATGSLSYNATTAVLTPITSTRGTPNLLQRPLFVGIDGGHVTAALNSAALAARTEPTQLLLLHLHNPLATQSELVTVNRP
jgi:hypothetical protein